VQRNGLRLVTLGRLGLVGPSGDADPSLSARRRKLAVLAVLALARRPLSRDQLTEMFWGGQPDGRARHSLSNTLSHLRRVLGRDAISAHGTEVELLVEDWLEVDALAFAEAIGRRDDAGAVQLYGGPFLAGVYVDGSATFEQWVAGERHRLEGLFLQACARHCHALARARRWEECAALARRWLDAAPVSADAALYLLNALKAPGTRESYQRALAEYRRLHERLTRDYELRPEKAVAELARELADQVAAAGVEPGTTAEFPLPAAAVPDAAGVTDRERPDSASASNKAVGPNAPPPPAEASAPAPSDSGAPPERAVVATSPEPTREPPSVRVPALVPRLSRRAKRRMIRVIPLGAALTLTGTAIGVALARPDISWPSRAVAASGPPIIAIIDVGFIGSDTTNAWITEGLPQMVAAKLGRANEVEVIRPERVRELRVRAELPPATPVPAERALELARRLGATWSVTGAVLDADTALQLDLTIRDVRTGEPIRRMELRARNLLALADAAATRLLDAAGSTRQGPQLADIGTPSVEAYEQYIRYLQLASEHQDAALEALDSAVALDSGFISALRARMEVARRAGDRPAMARLDAAFQRAAYRATDWDRLSIAAAEAYRSGNWARTEAAARALVERFPRDPRAYQWLTHVYHMQGRWDDAERAATMQLALDSLASAAGRGPCVPCAAYYDAAGFRMGARGDLQGAERLLRRLVELQPEMLSAWSTLAMALALQGRFDDGIAAARRAVVLSGRSEPYRGEVVRILLMARRYDSADSAVRVMAADTSRHVRAGASELRYLLERERGQFRASIATIDALVRDYGAAARDHLLARAEAIGRTGDHGGARRAFEQFAHARVSVGGFAAPDLQPLHTAESARTFAWAHSLMADAIAPAGDTLLLRVLADSIQQIGQLSYYGRDRRLHHHVRGLISARAGRWQEAERHFQAARWGAFMWTRTLIEEARAQMAQGHSADAVATLRQTYAVPLDGMGRYVPRSELDYWMALAFRRAGRADSAAVYAAHVRRAWRDADPPARRMLQALE
jgi:DNA-binding SARP family transcriptional activator